MILRDHLKLLKYEISAYTCDWFRGPKIQTLQRTHTSHRLVASLQEGDLRDYHKLYWLYNLGDLRNVDAAGDLVGRNFIMQTVKILLLLGTAMLHAQEKDVVLHTSCATKAGPMIILEEKTGCTSDFKHACICWEKSGWTWVTLIRPCVNSQMKGTCYFEDGMAKCPGALWAYWL